MVGRGVCVWWVVGECGGQWGSVWWVVGECVVGSRGVCGG